MGITVFYRLKNSSDSKELKLETAIYCLSVSIVLHAVLNFIRSLMWIKK